jgi:hypothetical protein
MTPAVIISASEERFFNKLKIVSIRMSINLKDSENVTDRPYCQCQACQDLALYMDTLPVEVSDSPACNLLSLEHPAASCHSAYDPFSFVIYPCVGYHLLLISRGLFPL